MDIATNEIIDRFYKLKRSRIIEDLFLLEDEDEDEEEEEEENEDEIKDNDDDDESGSGSEVENEENGSEVTNTQDQRQQAASKSMPADVGGTGVGGPSTRIRRLPIERLTGDTILSPRHVVYFNHKLLNAHGYCIVYDRKRSRYCIKTLSAPLNVDRYAVVTFSQVPIYVLNPSHNDLAGDSDDEAENLCKEYQFHGSFSYAQRTKRLRSNLQWRKQRLQQQQRQPSIDHAVKRLKFIHGGTRFSGGMVDKDPQ